MPSADSRRACISVLIKSMKYLLVLISLSLGQMSVFDKAHFQLNIQLCTRISRQCAPGSARHWAHRVKFCCCCHRWELRALSTWQELALWWQAGILQSRIKVHLLTELFEEAFTAPAHAVHDSRLCYHPLNLISTKLILKIK